MKQIIKNLTISMTCAAAALFMGSCDTDVEPVDINTPSIATQNPELYKSYLESLRAFKKAEHKTTLGWFDNSSKLPQNQAQHIHSVPDSLDYVVLTNPEHLTSTELKEMKEIREDKGTKVVYEIDFDAMKRAYDIEKKDFEDANENQEFVEFSKYLVDTLDVKLKLCAKYNFDGVIMAYNSKSTIYMGESEQSATIRYENDFIGIAKDWAERNADKELILMGKPQNVLDKSVFANAKLIILPCQGATSASGLTYIVNKACAEGVPNDKMIPLVAMTSLDSQDKATGYWINNTIAVIGAARCVAGVYNNYVFTGLAIDNISNDYYHSAFTYPYVRTAISIINPSVKN